MKMMVTEGKLWKAMDPLPRNHSLRSNASRVKTETQPSAMAAQTLPSLIPILDAVVSLW